MSYSIDEMQIIAERAAASKMFRGPVKDSYLTTDQAFILILKGSELGLPATTALGMSLIGGKPVLDAASINTLLAKNGYNVVLSELSDEACTLVLHREGGELPGTRTSFTFAEAKKADLPGRLGSGKNWELWRQDMLYARCVSRMARRHAPAIFGGGVYAPGEVDEEPAPPARPIPDMTGAKPHKAGQGGHPVFETLLAEIYGEGVKRGYTKGEVDTWLKTSARALECAYIDQVPLSTLEQWRKEVRGWAEKPQGADEDEDDDKRVVIHEMASCAEEKGYTAQQWEAWVQRTLQQLRVSALEDAPLVNLQRIRTQVQHWPDKSKPADARPAEQGADTAAARLMQDDESLPF